MSSDETVQKDMIPGSERSAAVASPIARFRAWLTRRVGRTTDVVAPTEPSLPPVRMHEDIDQGLQTLVGTDLERSIQLGVTQAVRNLPGGVAKGLDMANVVAVPEKTRQSVNEKVGAVIDQNLAVGLKSTIDNLIWKVSQGMDSELSINPGMRKIEEIFSLAEQRGISLALEIDSGSSASEAEGTSKRSLNSRKEIIAYV